MFKRLRISLTVFCAVITGIILVGMSVFSLILTESTLKQRGQATFATDVNPVLYHISSQKMLDHTWLSQTETNGRMMLYLEDSGMPLLFSGSWSRETRKQILSLAKDIALTQHGFDIGVPPDNPLQTSQIIYSFTDPQGESYYAAAAVVPLKKGWVGLVMAKPMSEEKAEVAQLRMGYAALTAIAMVLLIVFAWIFTGRAIRPVEESRKRQMEFVSAASHELRSPLAVIEASTTAGMQAPPDKARHFQETILEECHRMSRLIGDMLLLASADNRTWSIHKEPTEPETLLLNMAEGFEAAAAQKFIQIKVILPGEPLSRCSCDKQRIEQVLAVLLDNAISYTGENGKIELSAREYHDHLELRVADNGSGISNEYKEAIFNRFYRLDAARTKKAHYGLGLSIAREIATLHKGTLKVEDAVGGGSVFVLSLPL
ncbi:MAG: HAMP domain-containing sensor histidine kinase [Angelakisella sp.]